MLNLIALYRARRTAKVRNNPPRSLEALNSCGLTRNMIRQTMRMGYSGIPIGSRVLEAPPVAIGSRVLEVA